MLNRHACLESEIQHLCRFQHETRRLYADGLDRRGRNNGIVLKTWSLSDAAGALLLSLGCRLADAGLDNEPDYATWSALANG